jgi:hypothetical protein
MDKSTYYEIRRMIAQWFDFSKREQINRARRLSRSDASLKANRKMINALFPEEQYKRKEK